MYSSSACASFREITADSAMICQERPFIDSQMFMSPSFNSLL